MSNQEALTVATKVNLQHGLQVLSPGSTPLEHGAQFEAQLIKE